MFRQRHLCSLGAVLLLPVLLAAAAAPPPPPWTWEAPAPVSPLLEDRLAAAAVEAASGTARCPRAALFFSITLLAIRDKPSFTPAVKLAYKQSLLRLSPKASIIPVAIGPMDTGQVVQTVAVFPGSLADGLAAAQALSTRLRAGNLNAVLDERRFGRVHPEAVSQPFLADSSGNLLAGLAGSQPAGMVSVTWYDKTPEQITPALRNAYAAAIKSLVPGAAVTYATHTVDGDWTGEAGGGGRYAALKLAFDTMITQADPAKLAAALRTIRDQPGKVWPFGQLHSEDGYGVRWVPGPGFVSPCDERTTLQLTGIVAGSFTFDDNAHAEYMAALRAKLPAGTNTTVESVTRVAIGWKVVTRTVYPDDQQTSTLALARQLLPLNDPLGPNAVGPNRPVFLTEAVITTGDRTAKVFASHLMLLDARSTSTTSGRATAAAFPADGFVKYEFHVRQAGCPACPDRVFLSNQLTADFPGLPEGTLFNVTVFGTVQNNAKVAGYNSLTFRTPAALRPPPQAAVLYKFTARVIGCPTCPYNVTVEGTTAAGKVTPGSNWLQIKTVSAVVVACDRLANTDGTCSLSSNPGFTFPGVSILGLGLIDSSKALLFTPASSTTLSSVTLGVSFQTTSNNYAVTFTLYQSDPVLLTVFPTQVATATFTQTWTTSDSRWKTFSLPSTFAVTGGRRYALIVSTTLASTDWAWKCCVGDTLPTGLVPGDFTGVDYSETTGVLGGTLTSSRGSTACKNAVIVTTACP
ncbi:hypothetical protein ABPG75_002391 [Micractinium tetrahymenae]